VDHGYDEFCLADPYFYDAYTTTRGDDLDFPLAEQPVPSGWKRTPSDDWLVYWPEAANVPPQGWKIHVSACLDNAEEVLGVVFDHCMERRIPFKFIRSKQCVLLRNAKYADRGASGKFVTIYPADEAQLETILTELGAALEGQPGPYILSDLRWGNGPLYVRYGGFAERYCVGTNGTLELAIADAEGRLVPDHRGPTFTPPPWATLPPFLEPHLAARANATMQDLPYRIERAIHFSNGGGLYVGVDERDGEQVVLKEARPHAGLDTSGTDAVERLLHEQRMLERLAGLDVVPAVRDSFTIADHRFLVLDYVDGITLNSMVVDRYPLLTDRVDTDEVAAYARWALDVVDALERAAAALHERGVVFGDLQPANVLVRPDGSIVLVDFEVASDVADHRRPTLAEPGFAPPPGCVGRDVDLHSLAMMRVFLFLPLNNLCALDRAKVWQIAEEIPRLFPVPADYVTSVVPTIAPPALFPSTAVPPVLQPDEGGWLAARDSMAAAILASATPERDDRLFPGDIKQFETGGLNLAHGAAGVLYALAETGAGRFPNHEQWLIDHAVHPEPGVRLGFYDGLHGVAFVLDRLGHTAEAQKVLDICANELTGREDRLGVDLFGGLSGIGLNLAHFAAAYDDPALFEAAWTVARVVADRLGDEDDVPTVSGGANPYAGLIRGSSGPALFFLRLYEQSGDTALLDLAATALRQDLRRCVTRDDGALEVDEGWRTMPYIADGSVGIGMVLEEYLRHRSDDRFEQAAAGARRTANTGFFIEPGLFYGRAGMILSLSRTAARDDAAVDGAVAEHVRRLSWHAMTYQGHLAFPGEQLLRLSMDLATGTAGVLLALGAALHEFPVHLPFLGPSGRVEPEVAATTSNQTGRR
jgi:hypothetical protein